MNTRDLLLACAILVAASIFAAPATANAGIDRHLAAGLSGALLLGGIGAAILAVNSDRRDAEDVRGEGRDKKNP